LYESRPNPFNPRTVIRFSLAQAGKARLVIYDVGGRVVRTLLEGSQAAGPHTVVWDGTDDNGHRVGSGVYWDRLVAGEYSSNRRMVILN
jgi:flagellar hook assembly protein FlgD